MVPSGIFPRIVLATVLAAAAAGPAWAASTPAADCGKLLQSVNALLQKKSKLPPDQMEKAVKLRDQGRVLHENNMKKECGIALKRAEDMLNKGLVK